MYREPDRSITKTSIDRKWFVKLGIFWVVCVGVTLWGLYDGFILYPKRGEVVVSFLTKSYLDEMDSNRRLRPDAVNVEDPAAVFAELSEKRSQSPGTMSEEEIARYNWLEAHSRLVWPSTLQVLTDQNARELEDGALNESTRTMFVRPRDTLTELNTELANKSQPNALAAWDIPSQFLISLVFGIAGLGITYRMLTTFPKSYSYEHDDRRLTMPGGQSITPDDIEVVDKRLWHKFFVTLKLNSGQEIKLDLMRFQPLEDWILEMERHTEGYEPEEEEQPDTAAEETAQESQKPAE